MNYNIINQVIILSLILFVGVYARKKGFITNEGNKSLSELLLNVTLPLLILTSFNQKYSIDMIKNAQYIFLYSILVHIILIIISKPLCYKFQQNSQRVLRFVTIFSNSGFMGYPVLEGLYGNLGVFYGAIFNIPFNIFVLSYGIMLYTGEKNKDAVKNTLTHPGIIATVIGFLMFILGVKLSAPLFKAFSLIGSMTTPLSMLIVGVMLADVKLKEIFYGIEVYYASLIRLIIAPFITFIILKLLHADSLLINIAVVIEAMPAAVMASVLAEKYGADSQLSSRCVFITTILSMFTIPVIVTLL